MKTVIIVQARMTSNRLPGKVLLMVDGKPLLEYQIERLRRVSLADDIVIATTTNETDEPIIELCQRMDIPYYRGSEEDVLARYYGAAIEHHAETVIRVTSDCPAIDPAVTDEVIRYYLDHHDEIDYVRTQNYPRGLDTEVFSFTALAKCYKNATAKPDREHVTPYIYRNPDLFKFEYYISHKDYSDYRWTVDTPEDFELLKRIIEHLYPANPAFDYQNILTLLEQNPDWILLNAHIKQKQYGE